MTMGLINAVAQFERDLLIERTQAGLSRAKERLLPCDKKAPNCLALECVVVSCFVAATQQKQYT